MSCSKYSNTGSGVSTLKFNRADKHQFSCVQCYFHLGKRGMLMKISEFFCDGTPHLLQGGLINNGWQWNELGVCPDLAPEAEVGRLLSESSSQSHTPSRFMWTGKMMSERHKLTAWNHNIFYMGAMFRAKLILDCKCGNWWRAQYGNTCPAELQCGDYVQFEEKKSPLIACEGDLELLNGSHLERRNLTCHESCCSMNQQGLITLVYESFFQNKLKQKQNIVNHVRRAECSIQWKLQEVSY